MGRGTWLVTWIGIAMASCSGLALGSGNAQTPALKATQTDVVFSKAGSAALTMDYYSGIGAGLHPIAIVIAGNGVSKEPVVHLLAKAGYDVFSLNNPLTSELADPAPLQAVDRAIRYVRFHSREWNGNERKVALIGLGDGGYLSTLVGLANDSGVMGSEDAVDRETARVQAVVALFGVEQAAGEGARERWRTMLDSLLQEREQEAALAQSSPIYVNPDAPPFLLLTGKNKVTMPWAGSASLEEALKKVGLRCEVIQVQVGSQNWQDALNDWLTKSLGTN